MDLCGSTIMFISLLYVDVSVYQMMRGGGILFTALYSRIFFNLKLKKFHYVGMVMIIIGLIFIGLANFIFQHTVGDSDNV